MVCRALKGLQTSTRAKRYGKTKLYVLAVGTKLIL